MARAALPHAATESARFDEAVHGTTSATSTRWWALLVFLGGAATLGLSLYLQPDPRGFGTHAQVVPGPCGMLIMTGYPCPTCGMTTAFAHTVRGHGLRAFWAQPAGFVLALATIALTLCAGYTVCRGRWPSFGWHFVSPFRLFLALLALFLGAWAFKIGAGLLDGTLPYR